ncbi:MAG: PD-(D/E)XK nuclease family protein [Anaerolineae bacterium]
MGFAPVLTPDDFRILGQCPLHYHFRQQQPVAGVSQEDREIDHLLRVTLRALHAQGGPGRMKLPAALDLLAAQARSAGGLAESVLMVARQALAAYHRRLRREWPDMIASNETLQLPLTLGRKTVRLSAEVDRLDRAADGGVVVTELKTGPGPLPDPETLTTDLGLTALHALTAASYPAKRPVRVRQLWLRTDDVLEVELSEAQYRRNISALRKSIETLLAGQFLARPGAYCDNCYFKFKGCPVYAHETPPPAPEPSSKPKLSTRIWDFIDDEPDEIE